MTSRIRPHRMSDRPGIRSITSTGWKPARPCCRAHPLNNGTSQHDDPARPCGACAMKLVSIPGNPVPDDVVTGEITTPDGVTLRFARWDSPASGKGTVCVFTGRSEFIEKYFETVRNVRQRKIGRRTVGDHHALHKRVDVDLEIRKTFDMPPAPYFALAHSM